MGRPVILDVECIVCNKTLQIINHIPRKVSDKMGRITNRRSRTPNWSFDEKQFLLELIRQRKDVVVTKNNNGPNYSEEKDVAWNEILRELIAKFGNKFSDSSIKKVKTQWQNMKRIAREEISQIGPEVQKCTRQSLEVCNILDIVKYGVLKKDNENFNETTIRANVEIKTERVDEEINQPSCSDTNNFIYDEKLYNKSNNLNQLESSASSISEEIFEVNNEENSDMPQDVTNNNTNKKNVSSMTDPSLIESFINPFQREFQEFFRYSSTEKQLKLETLTEERQVVRAMRETAELNKIIAEQKLKHVLWVKKINNE